MVSKRVRVQTVYQLAPRYDLVGPAPFQLAADPTVPPLSYADPSDVVAVGQCPHVVPKEVLKTVRQVDFVVRWWCTQLELTFV